MAKQYKIRSYQYQELWGYQKQEIQEEEYQVQDMDDFYIFKNNNMQKINPNEILFKGTIYYEKKQNNDNIEQMFLTYKDLIKKVRIEQLGIVDIMIQAYQGTKFSINGNVTPIILGPSNIFQWKTLDFEGYINSIQLIDFPLNSIENITNLREELNIIITYGYYE